MQFFLEKDMKETLRYLLPKCRIRYMPHDHLIYDEYNKEKFYILNLEG